MVARDVLVLSVVYVLVLVGVYERHGCIGWRPPRQTRQARPRRRAARAGPTAAALKCRPPRLRLSVPASRGAGRVIVARALRVPDACVAGATPCLPPHWPCLEPRRSVPACFAGRAWFLRP